ncbi:hypothetical protein A3H38_02460 [candidate division WOR-1 bacterium RIFCSPLOWO2_02_FULL_46_20]|uniref:Uncharacterized protein n=1 Tax=candidate division WOR-1 bacterium RIFCSPLOWO2_02_FULL_46_20 TaxID=1802567 RepID=A0A1F4RDE1_UNCSA|nr:MAG: hypothetical protein A3J44_07010 [candidate division WOR-1 bacterium RIFCSPHIGHO2_02_FULL_45_12]OGC06190.1 MAG: hypothetical protein A3H38_02460 [candidate division WOR-1 bacterium RIFCSPLOWO2_02_FULL_46_20]
MADKKRTVNQDKFATKGDIALIRSEMATRKDLTMLRDELSTNFDKVFKELEIIREDKIFAIAKDRELEKRIKVLETSRA